MPTFSPYNMPTLSSEGIWRNLNLGLATKARVYKVAG
jgi:hypothetical protein